MNRKINLLFLISILVWACASCFPVKDCCLNIDSNTVVLADSAFIKRIEVFETNENRKERTMLFDTTVLLPQAKVSIPINKFAGKNIEIFVETNKTGHEYFLRICSDCWNKKGKLNFNRIYR